jgi:predicted transcriptional regulator
MGISIDKVIKDLPAERQERIQKKADEYIAEYRSLQEIRKSLGITQEEIALKQGITQVNISNLEKRNDMHLSTLRKYVEALGGTLEINIRLSEKDVRRFKQQPSDKAQ